jgi:ATP-dependent HslUV protease ATP-binding subunit HslU
MGIYKKNKLFYNYNKLFNYSLISQGKTVNQIFFNKIDDIYKIEDDQNSSSIEDDSNLTQNEKILQWLDKYIAGQEEAKKSLITIVSTRDRRNKLKESELKNAIKPSHAIFHGPTGCGKSYLISKLSEYKNIPFVKTEATQYTEVGYVGRDVEMMVKDLVERALQIVRKKHFDLIKNKVLTEVHGQIIAILMKKNIIDFDDIEIDENKNLSDLDIDLNEENDQKATNFDKKQFEILYIALMNGDLDDEEIEIKVSDSPSSSMMGFDIPGTHVQMSAINLGDMMNKILGKKNTKKLITTVKEAIDLLTEDKSQKYLNENQITKEAIHLAQTEGIIFIDEIDKIISTHNTSSRGEVSKEGVQRDLLPLLDGTTVNTKYGPVKTDHILFIAAGAFHVTKFSDLLPELQGRFPMSVKLHPLNEEHFIDILTCKKHSLIEQHQSMLKIDEVNLIFTEDSIQTIAQITAQMNQEIENTGARRLRTIIDKILEDINFESERYYQKDFIITSEYIIDKMKKLVNEMDLRKFIL